MGCYDVLSAAYREHWEPVLAPSGQALLERCQRRLPRLRGTDRRRRPMVVDVGTGAGVLAVEAARRWPEAEVLATDPSPGTLGVARARAAAELRDDELARVSFVEAAADRLPVDDAAADLVASAFVYQLVPDRAAALREARRVLRPGGLIGLVTWIADDTPFAPADAFDDVLAGFGIGDGDGDSEPETVSGDYASADSAAAQLRRAGFSEVTADTAWLEYRWDPSSYLACQVGMWDAELFTSLEDDLRTRVLDAAGRRLESLGAREFHWRAPVVYALGTRSAGRSGRGRWLR